MSKKAADVRVNEILDNANRLNSDIENYLRYCIFDGNFSHFAVLGAGTRDTSHDLSTSYAIVSDSVSLEEKKLGAAAKRKRDLRRLIMFLHSISICSRATGLTTTSVAGPIRQLGETALEAYLADAWGKTAAAEGLEWIRNNGQDMDAVVLEQVFAARQPAHKNALHDLCRSDIFQGTSARDFYLGQLRVAILLCELLSRPDASTLAALKSNVAGMGYDRLRRELTARKLAVASVRRLFVDQLPDNVDGQNRLNDMVQQGINFFKTTSVHADDGGMAANQTTFTIVTVPNQSRLQRMGFIRRAREEIGALDLVPLDSTTRGVSMYFLPWLSHYITKLTIPANTGPAIFFTAAINGCSVFITGTPQSPTIYHGGIATVLANEKYDGDPGAANAAVAGDSALFWRLLLQHLEGLADTDILGEANRNQYVKDPITPVMSHLKPGDHSTVHARAFEQNLGVTMPGAEVLMCNPWGCVFGLRTGSNWAFYLQENVTLTYMRANTTEAYQTCRPIYLSRIFPVVSRANPVMIRDATNVMAPDIFTPSLLVKRV